MRGLIKFLLAAVLMATIGTGSYFAAGRPASAGEEATAAGRYCGELASSGVVGPVETELSIGPDGRMLGSYHFSEKAEVVDGLLVEIEASPNLTKKLMWSDKYGAGWLTVTFDTSYEGFTGEWGFGNEAQGLRWTGKRCGFTIS